MSANNIRAGGAFVEIFATTNGLQIGLAKAQTMTAGFAASSQRQLSQFQRTLFAPLSASMAMLPATALSSVGATLTGLGMAGGGIAAGVTVPLASAGRQAMEFERQMAGVSTMLDDKGMLPRFREKILAMSRDIGESTTNLAVSLRELIGSAIAPSDALDVLDVATRTARAGMVDTATAALLLANNINAFQIPASESADIADTLFTIVRNGVVTFEELAKHFGESTATAHAAGISIQESGAAFATMTRNGLKADLAVTALNGIMNEFLKPSQDGARVAQMFGIELSTAAIRSKGFVQVMEELSALPEDALARIFPDVRGLRGMLALRGDLKGFQNDIESMRKRGGAMGAAFGVMNDTQSSGVDKATASLRDLAITAGTQLFPLIEKGAIALRTVAFGISQWVKENPKLIEQLALVGLGIGTASLAMVGLGLTATMVGAGLTTLIAPLTLVAGGIGLAVAGLMAIPSLGVFTPLIAGIATTLAYFGYFDDAVEQTGDYFTRTFESVGAWFQSWGTFLGDTMGQTWEGIVSAVGRNDLQSAVEIGVLGVEVIWTDAIGRMGDVWDDWAGALGDVFEDLKTKIAHLALDTRQLWEHAKGMATGEWNSPEAAAGEVSSGSTWWDSVGDALKDNDAAHKYFQQLEAEYLKERGLENGSEWAKYQAGNDFFNEVFNKPDSKWSKRFVGFHEGLAKERDGRVAAREANAQADATSGAHAAIDEEHNRTKNERRASREAAAAARRADAAAKVASLSKRLAKEREDAEAAKNPELPTGERPIRPALNKPAIPMPAELEKSARLPTTGSFSVSALRGMVGGAGPNISVEQRRHMIRLLEVIARAQREKEKVKERRMKREAVRWVDAPAKSSAMFT